MEREITNARNKESPALIGLEIERYTANNNYVMDGNDAV
jgi:hypothetical protein